MSFKHDCHNKAALVEYLYDECAPAERAAIAAHLAMCTDCAEDLSTLRATRTELAAWSPPETKLGFRIVSDAPPASVIRPARWWSRPLPAWAQAAAAVLIFAAGAGLGMWQGASPTPLPIAATSSSGASSAVSRQDVAALEQRLRSEMAQQPLRAATAPHADDSSSAGAAMLQQVRALIAESEQRQRRELALRTAEVIRDFDTQRRGDLARIERTFGQMEGATSAQVEQQRQMLNYLMRVSQRQPQ
jgi:hypothetical protein